jgi:hypothetical protein
MLQKQKKAGGDPAKGKPQSLKDSIEMGDAAKVGNDLVDRLEAETKKPQKKGFWVSCCGERYWVDEE